MRRWRQRCRWRNVRRCATARWSLFVLLEELDAKAVSTEGVVRGYKVKTKYKTVGEDEKKAKTRTLAKVVADSLKRLKKDKE